jgi:hypothetical protein
MDRENQPRSLQSPWWLGKARPVLSRCSRFQIGGVSGTLWENQGILRKLTGAPKGSSRNVVLFIDSTPRAGAGCPRSLAHLAAG